MTEHKSFFRNVFDAMIDSRMRQAEREMRQFRNLTGDTGAQAKR